MGGADRFKVIIMGSVIFFAVLVVCFAGVQGQLQISARFCDSDFCADFFQTDDAKKTYADAEAFFANRDGDEAGTLTSMTDFASGQGKRFFEGYLTATGKAKAFFWVNDGQEGECLAISLTKPEGKEFGCDTERNFICRFEMKRILDQDR